ncbi:MAG: DUF4175 family protein [bacterium]|nr:DUF4175 family protein [bacterium]
MHGGNAIALLERLRKSARRRAVLGGLLAWAVAAVPWTAFAIRLAGNEGLRGGPLAAILSGIWLVGLTVTGQRWVWRPWHRHGSRLVFAREVDASRGFGNLVVAAEEAARRPDRWPATDPVARELAQRLDVAAGAALAGATPRELVPLRRLRAGLATLAIGSAAAAVLLAGNPAAAARGLSRLLAPLSTDVVPAAALVAETGTAWVVAGGTVALGALDHALLPEATFAEIRFGDAAWTRLPAASTPLAGTAAEGAPATGPRRRWRAAVEDVREDFAWRFRRGAVVTGIGRVEVRQPPLLTRLSAVVQPPRYTGLPEQEVVRLPSLIEVPVGSRVRLRGTASRDLAAGWLERANRDSLPLSVSGRDVEAAMAVDRDGSFAVHLRDRDGLASRDPLTYRLAVLEDQSPFVALVRPGDDGLLPLDGRVSLLVEANDDYGLRDVRLAVVVGADGPDGGGGVGISVGPRAPEGWLALVTTAGVLRVRARAVDGHAPVLRASLELEVEAGGLDLLPGDGLGLVLEARDNREPGAGQVTRSAVLRLVLPSAADVLADQAEAAQNSRGELAEARQRGRRLEADLDRLARELLKNPVPDWARRQELEAAVERQRELQSELARVAAELQAQVERLASGQLTSERQLERASELAELLAQPQGQELADLLEKLTQEGSAVRPEEVGQALEQVAQAQKDLARRLDAALSLTQRMADEQRLEGLSALLEDMMRRQQELADLSERLSEQGAPAAEPGDRDAQPQGAELARRQEALAAELEQLQAKLEEALAAMEQARAEEAGRGQARKDDAGQEDADGSQEGQEGQEGQNGQDQKDQDQTDTSNAERNNPDTRRQAEKALRDALEKLKQQQSSGSMGKASQMLQQMDPQEAARMQQQALRDLGSLYSVLLASQQAMQSALKMEQVSSLRGLAADLLALSRRQEDLGARIPPQLQDVRNLELTRQQHRLQKATLGTRDRLAGLLEEAPNRILKLLEKIDALVESMGGSVRALEEGRAAAAREQAGRSLAEANRIVIGLLTEAQMAGGGGGGGGQQQSASEQLQELARRQAELNGATEELRRMLADRGISQEARSRMQRLGQDQAQLGRDLGRVAEQERERPAAEGKRLLGDMAELGRQMERLGGDLGDGQVDQGALQRQDRFLGRLLDARNALRQRDYSTRRESRAASRLFDTQDGGGRMDELGVGTAELPRFQRLEDVPLEYRDLVRRYFAAIDSLQRRPEVLP